MPTRKMLQLRVDQYSASNVTTVYPLDDWAAMFLDPREKTVVREISTEEWGGVLLGGGSGTVSTFEGSYAPFSRLDLFPVRGEDIIKLYGPSCVDSPDFDGRGGAMLWAFATGYSITGSGSLTLSRILAAHAYLDQGV